MRLNTLLKSAAIPLFGAAAVIALSANSCSSDNGNPGKQTNATVFQVTVSNVSKPGALDTQRAKGTVPLSPGAWAVYEGSTNPAFTPKTQADEGIERIAEDGFPAAPLGDEVGSLGANANVTGSGFFAQPKGKLPALLAGQSATFRFIAYPGEKLTLVTMFVQSNDWFYAFDGLDLFNGNGKPVSGNVTGEIKLYDAGTEADTPPGTGPDQKPAQGPTTINQGPTEDFPIMLASARHPDFTIPANDKVIKVTIKPIKKVEARTFDVAIKDVSQPGTLDTPRAKGTVPLSPGTYAVFSGNNPSFMAGKDADKGIARIAEDGFPSPPLGPEAVMLSAAKGALSSGVFSQPEGGKPAILAGQTAHFSVTATPGDKLTLATMFVQSNDWFYAFDGLPLFDKNGNPASGDVTDQVKLYDAGTEADTPPGTGPDQKPVQPPLAVSQGTPESVPIMLATKRHPDFTIPTNSEVLQITITPRAKH